MKLKFLSFSLLFAFILDASSGETCDEAKRWGFICLNATTKAVCVIVDGNYVAASQITCDQGLFCNEDSKNCSATFTLQSNYADDFGCEEHGFYPDLGNCQKYIYCPSAGASAVSIKCPTGYMYTTNTSYCSQPLNADACQRRKISCEYQGQVAVLPENNQMFYICLMRADGQGPTFLYPQVIKCDDGMIFRENNCVNQTVGSDQGECDIGRFRGDYQDCRGYFYCNMQKQWVKYTCPSNAYFSSKTNSCRYGSC